MIARPLVLLSIALVSCTHARGEAPVGRSWERLMTPVASMSVARHRPGAARTGETKVLVTGGRARDSSIASTAELFDRGTGTWTAVPAMSTRRHNHSATRLADGRILVAGGGDGTTFLSTAEIFDPAKNTWSMATPMRTTRGQHAAALLTDGTVLVAGGVGDGGSVLAAAETYDPSTNTWTSVGSLVAASADFAMVDLGGGRALCLGGRKEPFAPQLFESSTKTFRSIKSGTVRGIRLAAARLADGRVLVAGGNIEPDRISDASIYDPSSDSITETTALPEGRDELTITPLANGGAIAIGGEESGRILFFDAAAARWGDGGFGVTRRLAHAAIPFADEAILVVGGSTDLSGFFNTVSTAELFTGGPVGSTPDGGGATNVPPTKLTGSFTRCAKNAECSTGHCVDGVCCDTACQDRCHSCVLPSTPGTCTQEPIGVDLRGECGAAETCSGTCGASGQCIGSTAGSMCARAKCTSATTGVGPAVCAAAGAVCPKEEAVAFDCAPYACEPAFGACRTSCATSNDCGGGFVCDPPSKTCVASAAPGEDSGCAMGRGGSKGGALLAFILLFRRRRSPSA